MSIALSIALAAATTAPPANPQVQAFLDTIRANPAPAHEALIGAIVPVIRAQAAVLPACATPDMVIEEVTEMAGDRVLSQQIVQGDLKNGWKVSARFRGCPKEPPTAFLVARKANDQLIAMFAYNGVSRTSPSLFVDTLRVVAPVAHAMLDTPDNRCADPKPNLSLAAIASEDAIKKNLLGVVIEGQWAEDWRIDYCAKSVHVPVRFVADGQGGANFRTSTQAMRVEARPGAGVGAGAGK